jgi:hypothetical protein
MTMARIGTVLVGTVPIGTVPIGAVATVSMPAMMNGR